VISTIKSWALTVGDCYIVRPREASSFTGKFIGCGVLANGCSVRVLAFESTGDGTSGFSAGEIIRISECDVLCVGDNREEP